MPANKAHYRKPGYSSRFLSARAGRKARRVSHAVPVESIVVEEGAWDSMNKAEVQAVKRVVNLVSKARENSESKTPGVRLVVGIDRQRRIPMFEIEDTGSDQPESPDLDAALAEARERGVSRAVEILSGREMLSAAELAEFIGVSREAVRAKYLRREVLGLQGAKRGSGFQNGRSLLTAASSAFRRAGRRFVDRLPVSHSTPS
jgi:hypothetical protein